VPFRARLAGPGEPGEPITIKGRVLSSDCSTPIKNVLIEIWQTDAQGKYHGREDNFRLRGQIKSDDKGYYEFISVMPGSYRLLNGFRPAHIHIKISHPDYRNVVTQLYFKGDPYLWPNDACGRGCRSNDPNRIIELKKKKQEKRDILEGIWPIVLYPAKKKF
jgi:catechol 1,2-dioxygenase